MNENKKEDCLFCKFANKEINPKIIYEDEKYLAFLDINPMHEGHTVLIPKKHTDYIFDLGDEDLCDLFKKAKEVSGYLKKAIGKEKIGIAVEGFLIRHVHVHLVPINKGEGLDPCLQTRADDKDLQKIAEKIRTNIEKKEN